MPSEIEADETQSESRCVLTLPLKLELYQEHIVEKRFLAMEQLKNAFIALEKRKLNNLQRTKEYRELQKSIRKTYEADDLKTRKDLTKKRTSLLRNAGFSSFQFITDIAKMRWHFFEHITAQLAHETISKNVWKGFEKYLYSGAKKIHFQKRGTLPTICSEGPDNGMWLTEIERDKYEFRWSGGDFPNEMKKKIPREERKRIKEKLTLRFLVEPRNEYEREMLKKQAAQFRVTRKWVKQKYKYYLQVVLKGGAVKKRRTVGSGRVGIDIGTQTIAIAAKSRVMLLELADRVNDNHKKKLLLQQKMDRSRRATNPDNYQADGQIKRGVKLIWNYSKNYLRLRGQVHHLERKNADIRKYQHNCLANEILSLGTEIFVEKMNYKGLQARAKDTKKDEKGRFLKKKRFGKSLANKAPSSFLTILKYKTSAVKGSVVEVNTSTFRASQFDHTSGEYKKKGLGERVASLSNGDRVQRDLYSAFLLMNSLKEGQETDRTLCEKNYASFKRLHDEEMKRLVSFAREGKKYLSSFGVKEFANFI